MRSNQLEWQSMIGTLRYLVSNRVPTMLLLAAFSVAVFAIPTQYLREYTYVATPLDTQRTARMMALDYVKQNLLEELGTHVRSVVNIKQQGDGNLLASRDLVTLTAGVVKVAVLDERWRDGSYYIKASMTADPEEVLREVDALRQENELESMLRDSQRAMQEMRAELARLRSQLASLQPTSTPVTEKPVSPTVVVVRPDVQAESRQTSVVASATQEQKSQAVKPLDQGTLSIAPSDPTIKTPRITQEEAPVAEALPPPRVDVAQTDLAAAIHELPNAVAQSSVPQFSELEKKYHNTVLDLEVEHIFQQAIQSRNDHDFDEALASFTRLAEAGHPKAQVQLGRFYLLGHGVERDLKMAKMWIERAISNGSVGALVFLGHLYQKGLGVEMDLVKARELYEQAANKNNRKGLTRLGILYLHGIGVDKDFDLAYRLIKPAADQGSGLALLMLGSMHQKGQGVEQDFEKAFSYYERAIDAGNIQAIARTGILYLRGDGVIKDKGRAMLRFSLAAHLNSGLGHAMLGRVNEKRRVGYDIRAAIEHYERAVELSNGMGAFFLGQLYEKGRGVPQSFDRAQELYEMALAWGNGKARKRLKRLAKKRRH